MGRRNDNKKFINRLQRQENCRLIWLYNEAQGLSQLEALPYDVFVNVVLSGNLRGNELLDLCNSSPVLKEYCNRSVILPDGQKISQYLFRQLIQKENPGHVYEEGDKPRKVYERLTTRTQYDFDKFLSLMVELRERGIFDFRYNAKNYYQYPKTLQMLLYCVHSHEYGLLFESSSLNMNVSSVSTIEFSKIKTTLDRSSDIIFKIENFAKGDFSGDRSIASSLRLWNKTKNLPYVLAHILKTYNITLRELVAGVHSIFNQPARGAQKVDLRGTMFELHTVDEIVTLLKNYEAYYLIAINALLPADDASLENIVLTKWLSIVEYALTSIQAAIHAYLGAGIEPIEKLKLFDRLNIIKADLQNGEYNRVIKWLAGLHRKVMKEQYSIFSLFNIDDLKH
jgi:predicted transcriptional regulator